MSANQFKQKGFTLVEVIVVAVIVAALAAVSVPLYLNYVKSSRSNSAANAAGSVASFMGACINQGKSATGIGISEGTYSAGAATLICDAGETDSTSVNIPTDIAINVSNFSGNGQIQAAHRSGDGDTATYNY